MQVGKISLGIGVAASVLGLAAMPASAGPINADAYAFALNKVLGFSVTTTVKNALTAGTIATHADDGALYDGAPAAGGQAKLDPLEAKNGPGAFPGQNDFSANPGQAVGLIGARGDSLILFGNPFSVNGLTEAAAVAEGELGFSSLSHVASSTATDALTAALRITKATNLVITFRDDILLEAATKSLGASASAQVSTVVDIFDANSNLVFEFAPNGTGAHTLYCGGIACGSAMADPYNLQTSISSDSGVPSQVTRSNGVGTDLFTAIVSLLPGNYTIDLTTQVRQSVETVPEPASLALFGTGLVGLGWARRARRG